MRWTRIVATLSESLGLPGDTVTLVRVNGVAPATVVQGSAMFPRDRVIASLKKYNLPCDETLSDWNSYKIVTNHLTTELLIQWRSWLLHYETKPLVLGREGAPLDAVATL